MTTTTATMFDRALRRALIPIHGVSIGRADDRNTWQIDYTVSATSQQRADGEALRLTYNPATDTAFADDDATARYDAEKLLQAVAVALWECIPNPTMTKTQLRNRAIAIYKTLT